MDMVLGVKIGGDLGFRRVLIRPNTKKDASVRPVFDNGNTDFKKWNLT